MPYVASTDNGVIALHGGIPDVHSVDELNSIPKCVHYYQKNIVVPLAKELLDQKLQLSPVAQ